MNTTYNITNNEVRWVIFNARGSEGKSRKIVLRLQDILRIIQKEDIFVLFGIDGTTYYIDQDAYDDVMKQIQ